MDRILTLTSSKSVAGKSAFSRTAHNAYPIDTNKCSLHKFNGATVFPATTNQPLLLAMLLILILLGGLSGCTTPFLQADNKIKGDSSTADSKIDQADSSRQQIEDQAPVASRPFSEQTLYNLLVAELATHSRNLPLAIKNYLLEAESTRDPGVIAHATRLALYGRDHDSALMAAKLWYETEPSNEKASAIYADLLGQSNQPLAALDVLEAELARQREPVFSVLNRSAYPADHQLLQQVIARLETLRQQYPNNIELIFSYALLLKQNDQHEQALNTLTDLKGRNSDPVQTALLKAQLLEKLEGDQIAAKSLSKAIKKMPDERALRLYYARLLTRFDMPAAELAFDELLKTTPHDADLLFSHAVVANENESFPAARRSFEKLLLRGQRVAVSHYYIGQIDEAQQQYAAAIARYKSIRAGKYFMPATQRLIDLHAQLEQLDKAREHLANLRQSIPLQAPNFWALEADLLKRNGRADDAKNILNQAIELFPEQLLLRLERAFLSELFDDLETAEQDLRYVIKRDPNNVTALNALGYTLANRTDRYQEALELIERAILLKPDDAAIIDSLGWAQYRLGRFEAATINLETALEKFPDDEVAAHLIEVYWVSGQKEKARAVAIKMKKTTTETPKIDETLNRLGISL